MTDPRKPVYVAASDASPLSDRALGHACRMAAADGGEVVAVHVIEEIVLADLAAAMPRAEGVRETVLAGARRRLEESVLRSVAAGVPVRCEVVVSSPAAGILDAAARTGARMVVMGAHGGEGADRPGSVARGVVHGGRCDVLLVQGDSGPRFRSVICCTDFSEASGRVLLRAGEICAREEAPLKVLHVFVPPWSILHYRAPTPEAEPQFEAAFRRGLADQLEKALGPIRAARPEVRVERLIADAMDVGEGVTSQVSAAGADLAVIGATGRSALLAFLLGTTADRIIRDCRTSLLVVR